MIRWPAARRSNRAPQLRGGRRFASLDRATRRRRRLSAHAAMVRPASDRIRLRGRQTALLRLPLAGEPAERERIGQIVIDSHVPFMPEFARRFYPATLRLRTLLASTLGAPRLILGHSRLFGFDRYGHPGPTTQMTPRRSSSIRAVICSTGAASCSAPCPEACNAPRDGAAGCSGCRPPRRPGF